MQELRPPALEALPRDKTVFFLPVGPMEDHGPHLPIFLDGTEATAISKQLAQRVEAELTGWKTVLFPPVPLGVDTHTTRLAFPVRAHVLRDYLVDVCSALARSGFKHFVCVSGQLGPRQLTAIEDAGKIIERRFGGIWTSFLPPVFRRSLKRPVLVSASSCLVTGKQVLRSPFFSDPTGHGGERDTSVALHLSPGSVAPEYASLPPSTKSEGGLGRFWRRIRRNLDGYWGSPAKASAPSGEVEIRRQVDEIYFKLRAVLGGANPWGVFKSWYSVALWNQSGFKAWILALFLMVLLLLWLKNWAA